jgi:hypothetical protein
VDAASMYRRTVAPYVPLEVAVARFDDLCAHRDRVVATSPATQLPWTPRATLDKRTLAADPSSRD